MTKASYKPEGSRDQLIKDTLFAKAFVEAKVRLSRMNIRIVGEDTPMRQALLEMYVAVSLPTMHNDFDNH